MPMKVYQDYIRESERWTASLGWWHSVAYGYAVSLRSAPLYSAWSAEVGWGDASVLRDSQDFAAQFLRSESFADAAVDDCYRRLEMVIPDSETFDDCSAACDTGIIHLYTLSLLRRHDPAETQYIASYCYDMVDAAAGDEVLPAGIMRPEHEVAIERVLYYRRLSSMTTQHWHSSLQIGPRSRSSADTKANKARHPTEWADVSDLPFSNSNLNSAFNAPPRPSGGCA